MKMYKRQERNSGGDNFSGENYTGNPILSDRTCKSTSDEWEADLDHRIVTALENSTRALAVDASCKTARALREGSNET